MNQQVLYVSLVVSGCKVYHQAALPQRVNCLVPIGNKSGIVLTLRHMPGRVGRSTTDHIFPLKQILEQFWRRQKLIALFFSILKSI